MRILIADDDKVNRLVLTTFLEKWGYEVLTAEDGTQAWEMLQQEGAPRLVILDWMMPGFDGPDICRKLRERNEPSQLYLILLTTKFQKQDIIEGLEAGADDYLTKPFDHNELRARLRAGRRILELHEEMLRAHDRLQFQASHDALTGLWNRAATLEILHTELARSQRDGSSVSVLMADLDHFKRINDTYGHLAGDSVLREVTRRLRSHVRAYDTVGRYGGEEFLIIMPGTDLATTARLAERLRLAVGEAPVDSPDGMIAVSLSLGVTASETRKSPDPDLLLREADAALYCAKQRGRGRVEIASITASASAPISSQDSVSVPPTRSNSVNEGIPSR